MNGLLLAGFATLVLGLNLMMIQAALHVPGGNLPPSVNQLQLGGSRETSKILRRQIRRCFHSVISQIRVIRASREARIGLLVALIGLAIIGLGIYRLSRPTQENTVILLAGANVASLGLASLVRFYGSGKERIVRDLAWFATGMGVGLIVAYSVVRILDLC